MYTHTFRAMNTRFQLWLDASVADARPALRAAETFVREVEQILSRFLPHSALSRVNRAPGRWHVVPPVMAAVVREALMWAERTGGLFDPTVLPALHAVGYTRSFEELTCSGGTEGERYSLWGKVGRWSEVRLEGERLYLPPDTGLDLGGIAKEWVADRVAEQLAHWGPCLVDAGGDVRTVGVPALWGMWPVAIAHPLEANRDVLTMGLRDAGLATSSRARRRWRVGDREVHHIIYPPTGQPAQTPVLSASVVADTAVQAGVGSKIALMLNTECHPALRAVRPYVVVMVYENGDVKTWWGEAYHASTQTGDRVFRDAPS